MQNGSCTRLPLYLPFLKYSYHDMLALSVMVIRRVSVSTIRIYAAAKFPQNVYYALLSVSDPLCHGVFWQLHLLCCWPDTAIFSRLSGASQIFETSCLLSINPQKHGVFLCQGGNLCGALLSCSNFSSAYPQ